MPPPPTPCCGRPGAIVTSVPVSLCPRCAEAWYRTLLLWVGVWRARDAADTAAIPRRVVPRALRTAETWAAAIQAEGRVARAQGDLSRLRRVG